MEITNIVGALAGLLTSCATLPQVIKAFRTGETDDLSMRTQLALISGLVLWILYGMGIGDYTLVIFNAIGAILTSTLITLKLQSNRS